MGGDSSYSPILSPSDSPRTTTSCGLRARTLALPIRFPVVLVTPKLPYTLLRLTVVRLQLQCLLEFRECVRLLTVGKQQLAQTEVGAGGLRIVLEVELLQRDCVRALRRVLRQCPCERGQGFGAEVQHAGSLEARL